MSLHSVLDWMASSICSGGTSPVGRTTFSRSGVDMSESLTAERIGWKSSPAFDFTQSCTARKMSASGAQNESRDMTWRMPF
jgi:hypothetical protein